MKLEKEAGLAALKKAGLIFTARYLNQIMDFYMTGFKTYPEEIQMIARLFDEIHDVNIKVTEKRFEAVKTILKGDFVIEALNLILENPRIKTMDIKAYETAEDTYQRIKNGMIPLLIYDEAFPIISHDKYTEVYSMGDININVSAIMAEITKKPENYPIHEIQADWIFWSACKPDKINAAYAMNQTDLRKPLLFLEKKRGEFICADGFHRLFRAYQEDVKMVPIYRLQVTQYLPYLLDMRSYRRFVSYWNESLFNI